MPKKKQTRRQHITPLATARLARELSIEAVMQKLMIPPPLLQEWEAGRKQPNAYFRRKLCRFYGMTAEALHIAGQDDEVVPGIQESKEAPPQVLLPPPISPASLAYGPISDPAVPLVAQPLRGREEDLRTLRTHMDEGMMRVMALYGLPGVGKTTLAAALAHDDVVRARYADGMLWAGLGPTPSIERIFRRWGALLGLSASEMDTLQNIHAWTKALHRAIGRRTMLLVIDDAWAIEAALALKIGGDNCLHLITTRFPTLALQIVPTSTQVHQVQELELSEGAMLLRELAPEVVQQEEQKIRDLIKAVGGLPLALTLMGKYLHAHTVKGVEDLQDALARLQMTDGEGTEDSEQRSLRSVIALSDQHLPEQARRTLYALSVFPPKPNSFSEEAALTVATCDYETLDSLTDAGLLESTSGGRYTLHQTITDYARLHQHDHAPQEHLIQYVIQLVEAHAKDYERLDQEQAIIVQALEATVTLDTSASLIHLVKIVAPYLLLRSYNQVAERFLQCAYDTASVLERSDDLIHLGLFRGELARKRGILEEAATYFQQGLELAQQKNDQFMIAQAKLHLGEVEQKRGNLLQAETLFHEGLTLARGMNDQLLICALLTGLGNVHRVKGEHTLAEQYLQEGLQLARELRDRERICMLLRVLGALATLQNNYIQAETYLQEGLALAQTFGNQELYCSLLTNLGVTMGEKGKYEQAKTYLLEGLQVATRIEHQELLGALLANLGNILNEQREYVQAEHYFHEGLVLARQVGNQEWMSLLLLNLGAVTSKQKKYVEAENHLTEGLTMAKHIGVPQMIANVLYEFGNHYLYQRKLDLAERMYIEILETIQEGGSDLLALAHYGLAQVVYERGNTAEAYQRGCESLHNLQSMQHGKAKEVDGWLKRIAKPM